MRIVIVSYNWPPRNAIGTHRPYTWAKYWSQAGNEVSVLTAEKYLFDSPLDLEMEELSGVKVIEIRHRNSPTIINGVFKYEILRNLAKRLKALISKKLGFTLDQRKSWQAAARNIAIELATESDVVISTYGPESAHLIANDMKCANRKIQWVADYRDLWSQSHSSRIPHSEVKRRKKLELATVGENADFLTAVSKDLTQKLANFIRKPTFLIPNGFDVDEEVLRERIALYRKLPNKIFRIVYTGTVYEEHQDPIPLLNALVKLKNEGKISEGAITVDFYGSRLSIIHKLADEPQYKNFIRIMGHVPRQVAIEAQRASDLLLLMESPQPEARGVLTGKIFEYIAAVRPILAIGSLPEYEIGQVLQRTGTGRTFGPDEYDDLPTFLMNTLEGRGLLSLFNPVIEEINTFSRKKSALALLDLLLSNNRVG